MIEIAEQFTVATTPEDVYRVMSDPRAVVECMEGAELGEAHEDGSLDVRMVIRFGALRINFDSQVVLELDDALLRGVVTASGRDRQGGARFKATSAFQIEPENDRSSARVHITGEVDISGKLASMIANAATTVVGRMTSEFATALAVRCSSSSAQIAPASPASGGADERQGGEHTSQSLSVGVLLLHGFAGTPINLRPWGDALAAAGVGVSIPRLPGHGTRWRDVGRVEWSAWIDAAEAPFEELSGEYDEVFVGGVSLGGTLALRLAESHPDRVAGLIVVNPILTGLEGFGKGRMALRPLLRSRRFLLNDVRKDDVAVMGYNRVPLRAVSSVQELAAVVRSELDRITSPLLLVTSATDHVVAPGDGEFLWAATGKLDRSRLKLTESYHVVPLDHDAADLFSATIDFVETHTRATSARG